MRQSIVSFVASIVMGTAQATGADGGDVPASIPHHSIAKQPRPAGVVRTAPADVPPRDATPLDLSEPVIRKAIADSREPGDDAAPPHGATFGASGPTGPQGVDQGFKRAEIPSCMTTAAYTFDPPQVGPLGLGGYLGLPILVQAIVTGKCRH